MSVVESDWEAFPQHDYSVRYRGGPVPALNQPIAVEQRLEAILRELGERLNPYEQATEAWIRAKRDREKKRARAFLRSKGSVAARNAIADYKCARIGLEAEAAYTARKGALDVLKAQATACESLLRNQREMSS